MSGMEAQSVDHDQFQISTVVLFCEAPRKYLMVRFFGVCSFLVLLVLALLLVVLPLVLPPLPPPPLALLLVPIGIMLLLIFIALVPSKIVVSSV